MHRGGVGDEGKQPPLFLPPVHEIVKLRKHNRDHISDLSMVLFVPVGVGLLVFAHESEHALCVVTNCLCVSNV